VKPDLRSLPLEDLEAAVVRLGEPAYRAKQIFRWLHRRGVASFDEMTDVPAALRARLGEAFTLSTLAIDRVQQSVDGTRKYRLRTADGKLLEAVYMPDEKRRTLCVSSQVGCAMGCTFCLTATMGLIRHMTPGEMVDQVHRVNADLRTLNAPGGERPVTNLVFMGMGEPLHNFENLKIALRILEHPEGPGFSHRHITVSTSGLVPVIARFGAETDVKLAISLNAATDEARDRIMPLNRKWPIAKLIEAARSFPTRIGRRVTFEYVLLEGVNDTEADAERLARWVRGIAAKVNLIPYNENPGLGFHDPGTRAAQRFRERLVALGVDAFVRKNRGRDIAAACGQLAVEGERSAAKERRPPETRA
jgi:23S rRNA (adenine2503-C2)-methyltransferase